MNKALLWMTVLCYIAISVLLALAIALPVDSLAWFLFVLFCVVILTYYLLLLKRIIVDRKYSQ